MTECDIHGFVGSIMICVHLRSAKDGGRCLELFVRRSPGYLFCLCGECVALGEALTPPNYFDTVEFGPTCTKCVREWQLSCGGRPLDALIEEQRKDGGRGEDAE